MGHYRKKRFALLTCLVAFVLFLGMGYAAFSSTLKINGKAIVDPNSGNFRVVFANSANPEERTYVNNIDVEGVTSPDGLDSTPGTFSNDVIFSGASVEFTDADQFIEYNFLIYNVGKYNAYLTNITFGDKTCTPGEGTTASLVEETCENIDITFTIGSGDNSKTYTRSNDPDGRMLSKNTYEPVTVRIEYKDTDNLADGPFTVEFDSIELTFSTTTTTIIEP